jgi:hypothetical protein
VASEEFVHAHGLENQAIEIVAQALATDGPEAFESSSAMEVVGYNMTKVCADKVFKDAGFAEGQGRDQVGVLELHDCFAANEVHVLNILLTVILTVSPSLLCTPHWVCVESMKLTRWSNVEITRFVTHIASLSRFLNLSNVVRRQIRC